MKHAGRRGLGGGRSACGKAGLVLAASSAAFSVTLPARGERALEQDALGIPRVAVDPPQREFRVRFRAGEIQMAGELDRLELERDVLIIVDRYRLSSEHLRMRRGPRGLEVEGEGRLAFCPCESSPFELGFSSATVAPPTDLLIEDPTLRVLGVPVFWLPYFWLRSPRRVGLLPPRVAYRARDGWLLGGGLHVPLDERNAERASLDVTSAGYLQGGAEVTARVTTPTSSTFVRWDHLRETLWEVDAQGAVASRSGAEVAWDVDAIRGERALRGPLSLAEVARRYDRADFLLLRSTRDTTLGFGVRGDTLRGGPADRWDSAGPQLFLGWAGALGSSATAELSVLARTTLEAEDSTWSRLRQDARLEWSGTPGPFRLTADLQERSEWVATTDHSGAALAGAARAALALPLVRDYGPASDPLRHWVEPLTELSAQLVERRDEPIVTDLPEGGFVSTTAGVRSSLGRWARRWAISSELRAGALLGDTVHHLVEGQLGADTAVAAASLELGSLDALEPSRAHQLSTRWRLGRVDRLHAAAYVQGRSSTDPVLLRLASPAALTAPRVGYYDRAGWTAGGEAQVPWARWLASSVGADYDVSQRVLLALRGGLAYRHPCGCFALTSWAGHRLGRRGVDASVTLDLLP